MSWADNLSRLISIAHGSPDEGQPLKIGGKASAVGRTAVKDADRVDAWLDLHGRWIAEQREITGESQTGAMLGLLTDIRDTLARIEVQLSAITEVELS